MIYNQTFPSNGKEEIGFAAETPKINRYHLFTQNREDTHFVLAAISMIVDRVEEAMGMINTPRWQP